MLCSTEVHAILEALSPDDGTWAEIYARNLTHRHHSLAAYHSIVIHRMGREISPSAVPETNSKIEADITASIGNRRSGQTHIHV